MAHSVSVKLRRFITSVATRLSALIVLLVILSFSLVYYLNYSHMESELKRHLRHSGLSTSDLILRATKVCMLNNSRDSISRTIQEIGDTPDIKGIWIYDKKGRVAYSSVKSDVGKVLSRKDRQCKFCHKKFLEGKKNSIKNRVWEVIDKERGHVLEVVTPIFNQKGCYTAKCHAHPASKKLLGVLSIQMDLGRFERRMGHTKLYITKVTGILLVLTLLIIVWFIREQIHKPLKKLYQATKEIGNMNFDYKVNIQSNDEFGALARSFNRMTQRLRDSNEELKRWSSTLEKCVKEKNRVIQQAQRRVLMMEKMASLGRVVAVVAHELNNPLAGMLVTAKVSNKLLSRGQDPKTLAEVQKNLETIASESRRCGDLVKNLLMFSRRGAMESKEVDLRDVVRRSIIIIRHSFEMKNVMLIEDYDPEPVMIECVQDGIQQMTVALLFNALDATKPSEGRVEVSVRNIDELPYAAKIVVKDNGVGIPEEIRDRIFEPFFTTKSKDSSEVSGTGLGLAVVYWVVTRHGGKIDINSTVGRGTEFIVRLRKRPQSALSAEGCKDSFFSNLDGCEELKEGDDHGE